MRRLFIDVTRTAQSGLHTGIQRVVRRLLHEMHEHADQHDFLVKAAVFEGDKWYTLDALPPHKLERAAYSPPTSCLCMERTTQQVCASPSAGDVLLMADASWYLDPWPAVDAALAKQALLVGLVHDVFPISHPQWFRPELKARFSTHLDALARRAQLLITPSRAVKNRLNQYLEATCPTPPQVITQHLGADFLPSSVAAKAMSFTKLPAAPFVLMVGTIEPRKNHRTILLAFEQLWERGSTLQLVLVGAAGWNCGDVLKHIENHPELGRRLHWLCQIDDLQLKQLYQQAQALVFASLDEGFGLPLIEAANLRCPVLASDVPVLREVGGGWPQFVPTQDVASWSSALEQMAQSNNQPLCVQTWSDVSERLLSSFKVLDHKTLVPGMR